MPLSLHSPVLLGNLTVYTDSITLANKSPGNPIQLTNRHQRKSSSAHTWSLCPLTRGVGFTPGVMALAGTQEIHKDTDKEKSPHQMF